MFFAPSKSRERAKIQNIGVSKTSDPIQIKFKITNPYQEPPASFKDKNQNLKDMDVVCILKSRWRAKIWNLGISKTRNRLTDIQKLFNNIKPVYRNPRNVSKILSNVAHLELEIFQC